MENFSSFSATERKELSALIPTNRNAAPSPPAGRKVHAHSQDLLLFMAQRTPRLFYFPIRKSAPTELFVGSPFFTNQEIRLHDFANLKV
jgi:hypothetical protein